MSGRQGAGQDGKAAAIRRAAYVSFARHGYHGTTVDLICAEAGISKGAFYWHYDSKQSVFLAILDTWAEEVERELDKQFSTALTSNATVSDLAAALRRETHRVRAILPVWLEFIAQSGRNEDMRTAIVRFHQRISDVIARLIGPSLTPAFSEAEIRILATTVLGAFIGIVGQKHVDHAADFDAHVEQVIAVISRVFPTQQPKQP